MWLQHNTKELISLVITSAFIYFVATGLVPAAVFIGVAPAVVTYYFQERSKDDLKHRIVVLEEELKAMRKGP